MNVKSRTIIPKFQPDGRTITAAEPWFKVKVQVVQRYIQAFIMNAASKADEIVLVDLFAGSGLYSVGHRKEIFAGAALTSLQGDLPINRWILCERDPEQVSALQERVKNYWPREDVTILNDPLSELGNQLAIQTEPVRGRKTAILCLIDPFAFDVPLDLVGQLAGLGYSFIMPFTFILNDRLTYDHYLNDYPETLKKYAGAAAFESLAKVTSNDQFYKRLVRLYQNNMLALGLNSAVSVHKLTSQLINLPAYDIGFFSRQFSTQAVREDVNGSEHLQFGLFD